MEFIYFFNSIKRKFLTLLNFRRQNNIHFILYLNNNTRNKYCIRSGNYLKKIFEDRKEKTECTTGDNLRS